MFMATARRFGVAFLSRRSQRSWRRLAEYLVMFIWQNKGTLSKRRREGEFEKLPDDEVAAIEAIVNEAFVGF
jgi:hypothetical protein